MPRNKEKKLIFLLSIESVIVELVNEKETDFDKF